MELPPQVQALVDAISALPGVVGCFCGPKPLAETDVGDLSLPGEFGDLPQAIIMRTNGDWSAIGNILHDNEVERLMDQDADM